VFDSGFCSVVGCNDNANKILLHGGQATGVRGGRRYYF
jgi:hypothetical protein